MARGGPRPGAGHPRKPRAEKVAKGTLRPSREREIDSRAAAARGDHEPCAPPPCPDDARPALRRAWAELSAAVVANRTYVEPFSAAFTVLCEVYACYLELDADTSLSARLRLTTTVASQFQRWGLDPYSQLHVARPAAPAATEQDSDEFSPVQLRVVSP